MFPPIPFLIPFELPIMSAFTSKLTTSSLVPRFTTFPALATSVTTALKVSSGKGSTTTRAFIPFLISGISLSSKRASICICSRSATVNNTVPGLFIVPIITVSPSLTFTDITVPFMGDIILVYSKFFLAFLY